MSRVRMPWRQLVLMLMWLALLLVADGCWYLKLKSLWLALVLAVDG